MSMNTPVGNITQTTPIKDFKELDEMQNEQYLLGIDNNEVGNGSKISLENLINSSISEDNGNLITKGTDDRLLVDTPIEIGDLSDLTTTNKSTLVAAINEVDGDIATEATTRANADNNLQTQIDAITSASDVTDIVGTYAELQAYDTTGLADKSVIKVLQDESRQNETTYYRWVITGGVGAWVLIGEEGPYYTISQANSKFATQETVGNLSNLATSDKSSVVNAMNELASVLDPTQTADYIKNSKAIYSGEVSENALILPQIKEMAHSTFDLSKFTVVGSPIVTSDGIASGFSSSNHVQISNSFIQGNSWKIRIPVPKGQTGSAGLFSIAGQSLQTAYNTTTKEFNGALSSNGSSWDLGNLNFMASDLDVTQNANYVLEFTGTQYSAYVIQNGVIVGSATPITSSSKLYYDNIAVCLFGLNRSLGGASDGQFDLKQFSITVDGVEVFSGNKTGVDTIIPATQNNTFLTILYAYKYDTHTIYADSPIVSGQSTVFPTKLFNSDGSNYTDDDFSVSEGVVYYGEHPCTYTSASNITIPNNTFCDASITISDAGVVSNFRRGAYIYTSKAISLGSTFDIYFEHTTPSTFVGYWLFANTTGDAAPNLRMGSDGKLRRGYGSGNTWWASGDVCNTVYQTNTSYLFHYYMVTNTRYGLEWSTDNGETWTTDFSSTVGDPQPNARNFTLGGSGGTAYTTPGAGSFDISKFKIFVNGELQHLGGIYIPYTLSKTGSKIVNSMYRDRINDMAEQFGYANYYTLDEDNGNFTLPQVELYGLIEGIATEVNNKADVDLINVTNTSGFRKLVEISDPSITSRWYKVYKEYDPITGDYLGLWCEQGGYFASFSSANTWTKISLSKTYNSTAFFGTVCNAGDVTTIYDVKAGNASRNTVDGLYVLISNASGALRWKTEGYLAEGE